MSNLSDDEEDFLSADEEGFDEEEAKKVQDSDVKKEEAKPESQRRSFADQDDDDEEEALAERIRERNLRIARKFSAEIAKNVKASAPIPVKGLVPNDLKINDLDDQNIHDSTNKSSPPPAPPPTPALSSSFNSTSDTPIGATNTPVTSQYSWRVPTSTKPRQVDTTTTSEPKSDQTRLALDRLSESLSQSDKNLFEKVAADIKKVSIRPKIETREGGESTEISSGVNIPIISDLSSTLGGWNWNNATRLLTSASQVTSHVGTVIDSVSQHLQPPSSQSRTGKEKLDAESCSSGLKESSPKKVEADANDGLVDFTLNAMESLGKKAFGVMTERNESGSLQIKGLGRPWERLVSNVSKSEIDNDQNMDSQSRLDELDSKALPQPADLRKRKKDL